MPTKGTAKAAPVPVGRGGKKGGCMTWVTRLMIIAPVLFAAMYFAALQRQPQFLQQHWPQSPVDTSAGSVDLPILYYDGGLVGAFY
eukprot:gene17958-26779_t